MKVGGAADGELILTEVAQDQVWLDPDVEQTEDRYPELSKKGEHISKMQTQTFNSIKLSSPVRNIFIHLLSVCLITKVFRP